MDQAREPKLTRCPACACAVEPKAHYCWACGHDIPRSQREVAVPKPVLDAARAVVAARGSEEPVRPSQSGPEALAKQVLAALEQAYLERDATREQLERERQEASIPRRSRRWDQDDPTISPPAQVVRPLRSRRPRGTRSDGAPVSVRPAPKVHATQVSRGQATGASTTPAADKPKPRAVSSQGSASRSKSSKKHSDRQTSQRRAPARKRLPIKVLAASLLGLLALVLVPVLVVLVATHEQPFVQLAAEPEEPITGERRLELRRDAKKSSVLVASRHHAGSGFVYRRLGDLAVVVTNAHVITDDQGQLDGTIRVKSPEGRWIPAYPIWLEERPGHVDIALLAVKDPAESIGNMAPIGRVSRQGQYVTCSGFPLGEEFVLSSGHVRSLDRDGGAFKHDCVAERGSSGGPVFDSQGNVVGITTYLYMPGTQEERAVALDLSTYFSRVQVSDGSVAAQLEWQDMGLDVRAGNRVSVLAEGDWQYGQGRSAEARGVEHPTLKAMSVTNSHPFAALICRIGDDGLVHAVNRRWAGSGSGSTSVVDFQAMKSGRLQCRINDRNLGDNAGGLDVVSLRRS